MSNNMCPACSGEPYGENTLCPLCVYRSTLGDATKRLLLTSVELQRLAFEEEMYRLQAVAAKLREACMAADQELKKHSYVPEHGVRKAIALALDMQ